jgi:hypothetical protein
MPPAPRLRKTEIVRNNMELYKTDILSDLEITTPAIPAPHDLSTLYNQQIDDAYTQLRGMMTQRNRIASLVYAFYLGSILSRIVDHKIVWKDYTRYHTVRNERYVYRASIRAYQLFRHRPEQVYRTQHISLWALAEMSVNDFSFTLLPFADIWLDPLSM